jgi:hypothetical protein
MLKKKGQRGRACTGILRQGLILLAAHATYGYHPCRQRDVLSGPPLHEGRPHLLHGSKGGSAHRRSYLSGRGPVIARCRGVCRSVGRGGGLGSSCRFRAPVHCTAQAIAGLAGSWGVHVGVEGRQVGGQSGRRRGGIPAVLTTPGWPDVRISKSPAPVGTGRCRLPRPHRDDAGSGSGGRIVQA